MSPPEWFFYEDRTTYQAIILLRTGHNKLHMNLARFTEYTEDSEQFDPRCRKGCPEAEIEEYDLPKCQCEH